MEYTDKALSLIDEEKWYAAQNVLKKAVDDYPCCESYNNLGVFYIDNGIQHKNGESQNGCNIGYKYLKMAEHCDLSYKNLIALAEYNYYYGSIDEACKLYKKASELKEDYRTYNNMGCGCYKLGGYVKAAMCFDKALKTAEKNSDDIKISYCYSLLKCRENYGEILSTISDEKETALDRFVLYYFSGNIVKAYELADKVINEWEFNLPVLAMLYECIEANNIGGLKRFDTETTELVKSSAKRSEIIKNYEYTPIMLWQCKYIGCKKH